MTFPCSSLTCLFTSHTIVNKDETGHYARMLTVATNLLA